MKRRPVGQAAKTLASHAGNMGSIPVRVTKKRTEHIVLCSFFGDSVSLSDTEFAKQTHGFAFCEQGDGSWLTRAASKNIRRRRNSRTHYSVCVIFVAFFISDLDIIRDLEYNIYNDIFRRNYATIYNRKRSGRKVEDISKTCICTLWRK